MKPLWLTRLTHSLQQSVNQPESRFLQLATVDSQGLPSSRTVVFRGLDEDNLALVFISDTRSEKVEHLKRQSIAECCWYFTRTREQFRLRIGCNIVTPDSDPTGVCDYSWQKLSKSAKAQFLWGQPKSAREDSEPLQSIISSADTPQHFCVIKGKVESVDYLNLLANPQSRELHHLDEAGTWNVENVIP